MNGFSPVACDWGLVENGLRLLVLDCRKRQVGLWRDRRFEGLGWLAGRGKGGV